MPSRTLLDRSLALRARGYDYLLRRRRALHADSVRLRLLGRATTVLSGPDGTRAFYDAAVMQRHGAVPAPLARTLFGVGAVHGLDDDAHLHRKAMFLDLLTPQFAGEVAEAAGREWQRARLSWNAGQTVSIFDQAVVVHCAAICDHAGVPAEAVTAELARDLADMVDGFGSLGSRFRRAVQARRRANAWARQVITDARDGSPAAPEGSPLAVIADHREPSGEPLAADVAGVELLNLLRPTVAVAYFVAFTALALHEQGGLRDRLADGAEPVLEAFAHEVRRYYPFVPMLAARTRREFSWAGRRLPGGQRVLLDVYGTLHDPQLWPEAARFDLDRFVGRQPARDTLIPQGGGDPATGHRCPGERLAIELIKVAGRFLARCDYDVPSQDLSYPLTRIPARPRSGFLIRPSEAPAAVGE